jgi:hypothetical protein
VAIGVAGGRAEYGRALVAIEELRAASSVLSLAAHGGSLLARIQRIAGCQPPPRLAGGSSVFCILLVSVAAYLSVAANAAPPEEGTNRPPAASEARPAIDASDVVQTPSPDMAVSKGIWSLTLREAIRCALQNSKIMRGIGVGIATQPESSGANNAASATIGDSTGEAPNGPDRVFITRLNKDIPLPEFEAKANAFVRDVEAAYWDWHGNCRHLETAMAGRDSALARWRQIEKSYHAGERSGDRKNEAMAREQYYLFLHVVQTDRSSVQTAEAKLRDLLGLAPADKRHIRPADDPNTDRVCFDSLQAMSEAARRLSDAREERHLVKQRELELNAVKDYLTAHQGKRDNWAAVRNAALALAKERVKLQETELEIVHQLDSAIRDQEASFALLQAALDGRAAAQRRMDKATADYENGDAVFDTAFEAVFQCQGELSTAEIDYYRAVGNYAKSIAMVHYRKGSLLDYHGVHLAENSTQNADGIEN